MADIHSKPIDRLFEAILTLESVEGCYAFFEDLCTVSELQDMSQRFESAEMLASGMNYISITKELNISTATISRVSKCLSNGTGGYVEALQTLGPNPYVLDIKEKYEELERMEKLKKAEAKAERKAKKKAEERAKRAAEKAKKAEAEKSEN